MFGTAESDLVGAVADWDVDPGVTEEVRTGWFRARAEMSAATL